ncbi:phosphatase PAP2 family protein [Rhodococcoides fascians A25f]|uniref:phosphatase PAP2 family protein n=1 Tax=Rhodococcoides fascians TaxID=1828 RepID=UPI00068E0E40|nr:phosphatase PAP2 family protein [Rhodococcus fascians]QII05145.1 phosphatase PAP2 family protein [Rhodococcus fascians A25f]
MNSTRTPTMNSYCGFALAAAVLLLLSALTFPIREPLFRSVVRASDTALPHALIAAVAEIGLLVSVASAIVLAVRTWLRDRKSFGVLVAGGCGVAIAYLASEVVKVLVAQPRPCRTIDAPTVIACPDVDDWSWPSNHAVLAAAVATACVLAVPRSAWVVCPAAVLIAVARVSAGVHYPHDVLAGLGFGVVVVLSTVPLLRWLHAALSIKVDNSRSVNLH